MFESSKPHHHRHRHYYEEEEEDLFFTKKERRFIIFMLLSISICISYSLYVTPPSTSVELIGAFEPPSAAGSTEMKGNSKRKAKKAKKAKKKAVPPPNIPVPTFSWDTFEKKQMSRHSYPSEQVPGRQSLTENIPLGLQNIGNTCFMNAILQMLFHLEPFRTFVIDVLPPPKDETELVVGLKRLFTELLQNTSKHSYLIPSTFHHRLSLFTEKDHIKGSGEVLQKSKENCDADSKDNVLRSDLDFEDLSDFRMHDSSELLNILINHLQTVLDSSNEGRFLESNLFTHLMEVKQCPRGQLCPNNDKVQRKISPQIPIIPKFPNNPKNEVIDRLNAFSSSLKTKTKTPEEEENVFIRSWRWLTGTTNRDALNRYYSDCMLLRNLERMDVESVVLGSIPARINFAIQERRRKLLFSYSALSRHSALPVIAVRGSGGGGGANDCCESTEGLLQSLTELVSNDPLWRYPLPSDDADFVDDDNDDMTKENFKKTLSTVIEAEQGTQLPPPHPEPRRSNQPISIEHLMDEHFRAEYVVANCGSGCEERISVKKNYFVGSQMMIVSLSRVEMSSSSGTNLKIDNAVTFGEVLVMSAYACADVQQQEDEVAGAVSGAGSRYRSGIYNLQSVVVHGGGANGGHYWSYAKSGNQWYQLNDASVSKVQFSDIGGQVVQLGYVYSE